MRFPGQRKSKHYFPVESRDPVVRQSTTPSTLVTTHIVGIDQTLVDIEARVEESTLQRHGLTRGHSTLIDDSSAKKLYEEISARQGIHHEFAGGTIGNTLHNYSVLADDNSILLGVMSRTICIRDYAYTYLCKTSSRVSLDLLQAVDGPVGRCFALITPDGERTFAINEGKMNALRPDSIPEAVFPQASALVLTSYLLRCGPDDPMPLATKQAIQYAKKHGVPVVLTLGTRAIIEEDPGMWRSFIKENVNVVAMNEEEGAALTRIEDPLMAADEALAWCDLVLCTAGPLGLYMAGFTDDEVKRKTRHPLLPGSIPEFNRYEFSRPMLESKCKKPVRVYAFIAPFEGGPQRIQNTNGAGDGALSALLHDMAANRHHRANIPKSEKHVRSFLTYSSFSQVCKYANRVAYEVLSQHSPRLSKGLPEKEDSLEEVYWDR